MGGICRLVDIVDVVGRIPHRQNHSRRIAVTEIKSICTRRNNKAIFSSYTLSRRNISLLVDGNRRPTYLSPKESEAFVRELLRRNPHIEIIDK